MGLLAVALQVDAIGDVLLDQRVLAGIGNVFKSEILFLAGLDPFTPVAALSDSLSAFGRTARIGIEEMNELEDADSADILTEVSRGIDKWLWFVEAHLQAER